MQSVIAVVIIAILGIYDGVAADDLAWYKEAMANEVAPPYTAAYDALQKRIINPLTSADINLLNDETNGNAALNNLVRELNCGANDMRTKLNEALGKSEGIAKRLDGEVLNIVSSISAKEQEITQKQTSVASLNTQIEQIQQQVSTAEQGVKDKEGGVAAADNDLREAQRAVDKARECRGKRLLGFVRKYVSVLC